MDFCNNRGCHHFRPWPRTGAVVASASFAGTGRARSSGCRTQAGCHRNGELNRAGRRRSRFNGHFAAMMTAMVIGNVSNNK